MKIALSLLFIVICAFLFLTVFRRTPDPQSASVPGDFARLAYPGRDGGWLAVRRASASMPHAIEDRVRWIVGELSRPDSDPNVFPPLPETFPLRSVYRDGSLVYLDFSSDAARELSGGSADEIIAFRSLNTSLMWNCPDIDRVQILINGSPSRTFGPAGEDAGHVDIQNPMWLRAAAGSVR